MGQLRSLVLLAVLIMVYVAHVNCQGKKIEEENQSVNEIVDMHHENRPVNEHKTFLTAVDYDKKSQKKKPLLGSEGHHEMKHHGMKKPFLGSDDHDLKVHGMYLQKKTLLGSDDHDLKPHGMHVIGAGGHDTQYHAEEKPLLGSDDHDLKPHGMHVIGAGGHDTQYYSDDEVQQLLGSGNHDYNRHRAQKPMFGAGDHDRKFHKKPKKVIGGGDHDTRPHSSSELQELIGGGEHDYAHHSKPKFGYEAKHHGKKHEFKKTKMMKYGDESRHKEQKNFYKVDGVDADPNHYGAFKSFTKSFNKSYESKAEFRRRFGIFRDNMRKALILNQNEQGSAKYGVTKFADLTDEEFKSFLGLRPSLKPAVSHLKSTLIPHNELPEQFDWRDKGAVTPVKNQGMCGSCWAFSVTGTIEGQYAIKHNTLVSLSEQELVDCDNLDSGCNGGLPENAYKAIEDMGGLETEDAYPYDAHDDKCQLDKTKVKVVVTNGLELPKNESAIMQWLYANGPVSIGINANALQFYMGGVSHPLKFLCNPDSLDHGMLIVGYGVHTYPLFHTILPFWTVKNSWGADWGEKGYYRVYRGDGTCGVDQMASSAIVD